MTIVPAQMEHVSLFAGLIRAADCAEIWASNYARPAKALEWGVAARGQAWAGWVDDAPVCMFGAASVSLIGRTGRPWLLGTALVEKHQTTFLRHCRPFVAEMRLRYDLLENWVDERNTVAHRWLHWMGFTLDEPAPFGVEGRLFRRFEWRAS